MAKSEKVVLFLKMKFLMLTGMNTFGGVDVLNLFKESVILKLEVVD
ncbi:MAG: hypothetical protein HQL24_02180 [Candidatus Omnitrophica bacterium]|nr:hypothetical protein [Candidatus Omnitrophota bacterium]